MIELRLTEFNMAGGMTRKKRNSLTGYALTNFLQNSKIHYYASSYLAMLLSDKTKRHGICYRHHLNMNDDASDRVRRRTGLDEVAEHGKAGQYVTYVRITEAELVKFIQPINSLDTSKADERNRSVNAK